MIPHREFPAENQFTFADGCDSSDEVKFSTWAERIKGNNGYFGRSDEPRVGAWALRIPKNYNSHSSPQGVEFRWRDKKGDDDDDGSDVPSPTLWEKTGSPVALSGEVSPIHNSYDDEEKPLPPISRAQVIARYRQEMMDLVKDVPENAYELSLKDIVELPRMAKSGQQSPKGRLSPKERLEPKVKLETVNEQRKMKTGAKKILRRESMEPGGLFLKMFVPASLGRRKSFGGDSVTRSKVLPKPMLAEVEKGSADSEWWKKRELSKSNGSSSIGSRSNSTRRKMNGCYPFFHIYKTKAREE